MRLANLLFIALMLFGSAGCTTPQSKITEEKQQDTTKKSESEDLRLYNDAKAALLAGNYPLGAEHLGILAVRYPFANHTQQALLETAEDSVKRGQAATVLAAAEDFIKKNPNHPNVDYAYYHRGLIAFYDSVPALKAVNPATATPQASAPVRRAFQHLAELLRRTPNSKFAADTTQRMLHIRNTLAQHEVSITQHYLAQGDYPRAAARARYIVENYQQSPAATEALAILTQATARIKAKAAEPPAPAVATETPQNGTTKNWLSSQNPEYYTLQLFSTENEKFIKKHIAQNDLSDKADYFRTNGSTYALVYGAYPTKDAAEQAIKQLPRQLIAGKPWIRSFKSIHAILKQ